MLALRPGLLSPNSGRARGSSVPLVADRLQVDNRLSVVSKDVDLHLGGFLRHSEVSLEIANCLPRGWEHE